MNNKCLVIIGHPKAMSEYSLKKLEEFIKNNLFKPFKTTKGTKGMGIGVYEAREIIHAIGGKIEVRSTVDAGTCFKLTIPAAT